ncbi:helix-turn-helix transcriptional regulator [Arcicella aquatica]|uniref:Helix-turn-helix transcriptional regulator n=1 Tax=Arcicella aquatica TaxID=217141 RepID=A0ABU5QI39_9BACT|nr:helix-turn-helix transcriptional regulator [Arcicella aquatica]MEA5256723.1 helix-turn-helix transcriptional regulator [Arcicella aquatica]
MLFDFNLKSSILLIFFFHGIVFSLLLLKKGIFDQNKGSAWLSLFLFLSSLYIAPFMLGYSGWYSKQPYRDIMFYTPFQQLFLLGPIIYFYTQSLLNKSFQLSQKDFIHFIPAIAYFIYTIIVFVTDKLILHEYYFYADERDKDLSTWYQMAGLVSMMYYVLMSLKYYAIYKKIAFQVVSFAETILFNWVQQYLIALLLILSLRVLFFILNPEWNEFGSKFWYYLCFSILFYYISISGYSNSIKTVIPYQASLFYNDATYLLHEDKDYMKDEIITALVDEKDSIVIAEIQIWKQKIEQLMIVDKAFENPVLTLTDIAKKLDTNPKQISQVVNQGFMMNFNDLVNGYRIEAVKEMLKNGEHKKQTLLGIAFSCGFNSKSTFNRTFKKLTSLSPKEYINKIEDSDKDFNE